MAPPGGTARARRQREQRPASDQGTQVACVTGSSLMAAVDRRTTSRRSPGDATRSRPGQQLPQYPGQGHRGRVRRMERPGCGISRRAETAPVRDPLLHPRSRRSSDRSGANDRPRRRLDARSLAIEYASRGVRVNAEITREIAQSKAASSPALRSLPVISDEATEETVIPMRFDTRPGDVRHPFRFQTVPGRSADRSPVFGVDAAAR